MQFGIWVEPEMVNADGDLCRAHPDWVPHFPGRARIEFRNQLVLNLARTDVQDYLWEQLATLLSSARVDYVKWDFNRCFVSAMAGVLGVGGDLTEWSEEELAEAWAWVNLYKQIRPAVQRGALHRLRARAADSTRSSTSTGTRPRS